ncbi:hypothetical protein A1O3_00849 [Capronia epimyces CBS 606.96]|uniref:Extracellular membrane protein CFEM domain-containing protein n=1 Tax=Capronia epimyces CBS 606.96 TaxID=1182542 RepID=W9ZCP5_9EURO|nr:uncharacterized protein A1O3_00849 [Capronia epimyces CBS 606.96]EXJ92299.1 hypothetical protein A1O3_00849 [Capronia epimyces CBS 606.96]
MMILPVFLSVALSQAFANAASSSAQTSNITASSCVDPSGYTSCFNKANDVALNCFSGAGTDETVQQSCGCELYLDEIQCALESCWNQVYSCEYQELASTFLINCPSTPIPSFPAPDDAPNRCSCNLGYVIQNATGSFNAPCSTEATLDVDRTFACTCCMESSAWTSIFEICPDTDPTLIGYNRINNELAYFNEPFDQCGQYLESYNCVNDLSFTPIGDIPFLSSFPATTGTATLSNIGGSVTTPPLGATYTWTANGVPRTITAADAKKTGASKGSSTTKGSGAAATSGSTTTGSGSTSSSSSGASGSAQSSLGSHALVIGVSLLGLAFL